MQNITVGLAQLYPKIGDVAANEQKHLEMIEEAAKQDVNLLVFPELSLTGYYLRDLVYELAMPPEHPTMQALRKASREHQMDLVVGFVDVGKRSKFFIGSVYISQGEVLHIHHKVYLPNYTLFTDARFFAHGEHIRAFNTPFGRFGMLICEDIWHLSPAYLLWLDGADVLIVQNASPGRGVDKGDIPYSSRWVESTLQTYANQFTNYIIHCNRVGFEDGINFWGGSSIISPDGEFLTKAPYFEEALTVQTIDLNQIRRTRSRLPLLRDERVDLVQRELTRIVQKDPENLIIK